MSNELFVIAIAVTIALYATITAFKITRTTVNYCIVQLLLIVATIGQTASERDGMPLVAGTLAIIAVEVIRRFREEKPLYNSQESDRFLP